MIGEAIKRTVDRALEDAAKPGGLIETRMNEIIDDVLRKAARDNKKVAGKLTATAFVWQVAFEFMRTDRSMEPMNAKALAVSTVRDFLRDDKIKFGDPAYAWDQDAAITLAREREIDHWEAA